MKNYKLIGITGLTGSGKGEVSQLFSAAGYEVIYADFLAREIMKNPDVLRLLCDNFGDDVVQDNALDRQLMARRAFKNSETKELLDKITHPFISTLFIDEIKRLSDSGAKRILFDASQLFESGLNALCDCVISVTADSDVRLSRIMKRDSISEGQAAMRMNVQLPEKFFRENSDFVIENNSDFNTLKEAVNNIIQTLEVHFG